MPRKSLPYVNSYRDRTGKMRHYLRRPGCRRVTLRGEPGSRAFMQSYAAATAAPSKPPRRLPKPKMGQIYYLDDGEQIKIGFTVDWKRRQKAYRTHAARPPELLALHPGTRFDENRLHNKFESSRAGSRRDWFHRTAELLGHIQERRENLTLPNAQPN